MSEFQLPLEAQRLLEDVDGVAERAEAAIQRVNAHCEAARQMFAREQATLDDTQRSNLETLEALRAEITRDREVLDALVEHRGAAYDLVARVWAEYEEARAGVTAGELETKKHPAPVAAEQVREKGRELAKARREAKLATYIVELYESLFPWLSELRDTGEAEAYVEGEADSEAAERKEDPVSDWLTAEEYRELPSVERNQRALDRYLKSRKSNWQLGRDYERYIGYLREQAGCEVTYHGIFKGFEDLGRDVLAEKDGEIEVIQCKRWAQAKTIHEKHVFQLYGTVVLCQIENPVKRVRGTFTTTTQLSEKAREVAQYLEIRVEEGVPLANYPRIKCNVSRDGRERIYHLPMDQQYDKVLIEPERREYYASTVAEAEEDGFRRAWRWHGG